MSANERRVIHVAGLDETVTVDTLMALFSVFGDVRTADIPADIQTGKTRGFGFVEFLDHNDAEAAIDNMDQSEIYGRTITVKYSRKGQNVQLNDPKRAVWADDIYHRKVIANNHQSDELD